MLLYMCYVLIAKKSSADAEEISGSTSAASCQIAPCAPQIQMSRFQGGDEDLCNYMSRVSGGEGVTLWGGGEEGHMLGAVESTDMNELLWAKTFCIYMERFVWKMFCLLLSTSRSHFLDAFYFRLYAGSFLLSVCHLLSCVHLLLSNCRYHFLVIHRAICFLYVSL